MKNKITFKYLALIFVVMLVQVSSFYAQPDEIRQECVKRSTDELCIEIDTSRYKGYYKVVDLNNPATAKDSYQGRHKFKLKANVQYILIIGNEGNNIIITVANDGKITASNNNAVDTGIPNKIVFKTVEVFIEPNEYTGNYYLSIFYAQDLFYNKNDNWCPFAKNLPSTDVVQAQQNCPTDRASKNPIDLVPSLTYFVDPHGKGYDGAISFKIDNAGNVIEQDHPRAVEIVKREGKNILRFKNKTIRVTTADYDGKIWVGTSEFNISQLNPLKVTLVPYTPIAIRLRVNNSEKLLMLTNIRAIPLKIVLPTHQQTTGSFEFCIVGPSNCQ